MINKHLLPVFCLIASSAFSQSARGRVSFSFEVRDKWPIYRSTGETPGTAVKNLYHYPAYSLGFNLAYRFKNNLQAEIGYSKEEFRISGKVPDYGETGVPLLSAHMLAYRMKYKIHVLSLFKRNLYLLPTLGYTLAIDKDFSGISIFGGINTINLGEIVLTQYYRPGFEYGLRHSFNMLELRGQIGYELSNDIEIYFCGGYAQGFNTIGKLRVEYAFQNGTSGLVTAKSRGTNYYLLAGLAYSFGSRG